MRALETSNEFKKDYKRIKAGLYRGSVDAVLTEAVEFPLNNVPLEAKYRDHPLVGDRTGYRECHLKPDLLLIYRKADHGVSKILRLARIGTHSELFG